MLRFCDEEIVIYDFERLNRNELLNYFLNGHLNDAVYIIDATDKYKGKITYQKLISCTNIYDAITLEYLVLNENIWNAARDYCRYGKTYPLLPVLNEYGQMVCFAYDEPGANREIRMLRELTENPNAYRFCDIFPQYKCVVIYGFNELAFFFMKYLKEQGIRVCVHGELWKGYAEKEECRVPDYNCLIIYAEGVWKKGKTWRENLLRSVSVEFECIDQIYEANMRQGIIKNASIDSKKLLKDLKEDQKNVIIIGTHKIAQDVYDYFKEYGIDICCFVEGATHHKHKLFGKPILNEFDARIRYRNIVYVECTLKNSAWGGLDFYDYLGYHRNEGAFLIRDFFEIKGVCLKNALEGKKIVLAGDVALCSYLNLYLYSINIKVKGYLNILDYERIPNDLTMIDIKDLKEIKKDVICLIVNFDYFYLENKQKKENNQMIIDYLKENGIVDYTDYFSSMISLIEIEEERNKKYTKEKLLPGRIVLGSIESCCGNIFFRGMLDGHPSITMISEYNFLNNNLFWICLRLSIEKSGDILKLFWEIYRNNCNESMYDSSAFNEKMAFLLAQDETFTSQELFVMFHLAYEYMYGRDILNLNHMIIYWEPHIFPRVYLDECLKWLSSDNVLCDIVNVVRNTCAWFGSFLKGKDKIGWNKDISFQYYWTMFLGLVSKEEKDYQGCQRVAVRFEELKCNPKQEMLKICKHWGIEWSDTFLEITVHGKVTEYHNGYYKVSNFDLGPVYNVYEEYFSEFDRFRFILLNSPWQKVHGYSYINSGQFSLRELQEMFLKEFRFEEMFEFDDVNSKLKFDIKNQQLIRERLYRVYVIQKYCER